MAVTHVSVAARRKARKAMNVNAFRKLAKAEKSAESKVLRAIASVTREEPAKNSALYRLHAAGMISLRQYRGGMALMSDFLASKDTRTSSMSGMPGGGGYPSFPLEKMERQAFALRRFREAWLELNRFIGPEAQLVIYSTCVEDGMPERDDMATLKRALTVLADHYNIEVSSVRNRDAVVA